MANVSAPLKEVLGNVFRNQSMATAIQSWSKQTGFSVQKISGWLAGKSVSQADREKFMSLSGINLRPLALAEAKDFLVGRGCDLHPLIRVCTSTDDFQKLAENIFNTMIAAPKFRKISGIDHRALHTYKAGKRFPDVVRLVIFLATADRVLRAFDAKGRAGIAELLTKESAPMITIHRPVFEDAWRSYAKSQLDASFFGKPAVPAAPAAEKALPQGASHLRQVNATTVPFRKLLETVRTGILGQFESLTSWTRDTLLTNVADSDWDEDERRSVARLFAFVVELMAAAKLTDQEIQTALQGSPLTLRDVKALFRTEKGETK